MGRDSRGLVGLETYRALPPVGGVWTRSCSEAASQWWTTDGGRWTANDTRQTKEEKKEVNYSHIQNSLIHAL